MLTQAHQRRTQMSGLWLRTAGSGTLCRWHDRMLARFRVVYRNLAGAKATADVLSVCYLYEGRPVTCAAWRL